MNESRGFLLLSAAVVDTAAASCAFRSHAEFEQPRLEKKWAAASAGRFDSAACAAAAVQQKGQAAAAAVVVAHAFARVAAGVWTQAPAAD